MPTYICTAPTGQLSTFQKAGIAKEITRVHSEVTGAPGFFAQVIFNEVPEGNYFLGGAPLHSSHIFVHGNIRAGRGAQEKLRLLTTLVDVIAHAAGLPKRHVWVYIEDLPARQLAEYGLVLPEPGEEEAWKAKLSSEDWMHMEKIGS